MYEDVLSPLRKVILVRLVNLKYKVVYHPYLYVKHPHDLSEMELLLNELIYNVFSFTHVKCEWRRSGYKLFSLWVTQVETF